MSRRRPARRRCSERRRFLERRRFGQVEQLETRQLMAVNVVTPLADTTIPASPTTIDLATRFDLADVTGTVVKFANNVGGDIYAELFDQAGPGRTRTTPATAANFLQYVAAGSYTDTIVHRSVDNFVVQAGGFGQTASGNPIFQTNPTFPPVVNEPGNTNVRGTLAMAKLGNDPNSATNQFFFNLGNNASNLDNQNGGFTAFARVLGNGMTVVDAIAAVPQFDQSSLNSAFNEIPLRNYTPPAAVTRDNLVKITSVTRVGELVYTVTSSNPLFVEASVNSAGILSLTPDASGGGTATITVRAASVFDATDFVEDQFTVTVTANPDAPAGSIVVTGADIGAGSQPLVTVIQAASGDIQGQPFLAYESSFRGGVRVAVGDVVGDGTQQIITAPGPGREGQIRVFRQDGTEITTFRSLPYGPGYRGGIEIAVGDINGDGTDDIVTAASRGPGLVRVFYATGQAAQPLPGAPSTAFRAFPRSFNGGATVAVGDFGTFTAGALTNANAPDGRMEVVVGSGSGMARRVLVYDLSAAPRVVRTITPLGSNLRGGIAVSTGRYDANTIDDIIVAGGFGASSRIEVYSGVTTGNPSRLAAQQAFAALGRSNLPVYAAAIARPSDGQMLSLAVVQGGNRTQQGVRRIGLPTATTETSLTPLSGPLRIAASRPS
jgi:cyclophilin family peptidyl-prolyl cis-trans isomerase